MKIVTLGIGHSRLVNGKPEGGARSVDGTSEWEYHRGFTQHLADILCDRHQVASIIVDEYQGGSYGAAMAWLGQTLREQDVDLAVELHFNAATGTARGHEWLYWHSSAAGKKLATNLHLSFSRHFPQAVIPARGVKPRTAADRGALFLQRTHCPAVICEPFFGDNPADWTLATKQWVKMADAIATGIAASL